MNISNIATVGLIATEVGDCYCQYLIRCKKSTDPVLGPASSAIAERQIKFKLLRTLSVIVLGFKAPSIFERIGIPVSVIAALLYCDMNKPDPAHPRATRPEISHGLHCLYFGALAFWSYARAKSSFQVYSFAFCSALAGLTTLAELRLLYKKKSANNRKPKKATPDDYVRRTKQLRQKINGNSNQTIAKGFIRKGDSFSTLLDNLGYLDAQYQLALRLHAMTSYITDFSEKVASLGCFRKIVVQSQTGRILRIERSENQNNLQHNETAISVFLLLFPIRNGIGFSRYRFINPSEKLCDLQQSVKQGAQLSPQAEMILEKSLSCLRISNWQEELIGHRWDQTFQGYTKEYADFSLTFDDKKALPVHRIVLAELSPYFQTMVGSRFRERSGTCKIRGVKSGDFKLLIDYAYWHLYREESLSSTRAFTLADRCLLPKLRELCATKLAQSAAQAIKDGDYSKVTQMIWDLKQHENTKLMRQLHDLIHANYTKISASQSWKALVKADKTFAAKFSKPRPKSSKVQKWPSIKEPSFVKYWQNQQFSDHKLQMGNQSLSLHLFVIDRVSPDFASRLKKGQLPKVKKEVLLGFLKFCYTRKLETNDLAQIEQMMAFASAFNIRILMKACVFRYLSKIDVSNDQDLYKLLCLSVAHDDRVLREVPMELIISQPDKRRERILGKVKQILSTEEWSSWIERYRKFVGKRLKRRKF